MARQDDLDADACRIAATLPGCLVFNTTVVSADQALDTTGAIRDDGGEAIGYLAAGWARGENQGTVDDDDGERWAGSRLRRRLRVGGEVHLGEVGRFADDADHDMWWLRVMLVERVSDRPYVVRRVEVGEVRMNKWRNCKPRWEMVVLC